MNRERYEEIKLATADWLFTNDEARTMINELLANIIPEGRKLAEWKRELRETQEEYARLEKQRDELGDSLHNHAPGTPALKGYTPTWARNK